MGKLDIAGQGLKFCAALLPLLLAAACAQVDVPESRTLSIPTVTPPLDRYKSLNEHRDPVLQVPLGRDVLVPRKPPQDPLPDDMVGPYELRGETLASALQLILDDYDLSLAFETDRAMTQRISVTNMRGSLPDVVDQACSLANLYCGYQNGVLTVKDVETFVVDLPPLPPTDTSSSESDSASSSSSSSEEGGGSGVYAQIISGLQSITGTLPAVDETTRTMIYTATQRTQRNAALYFERLRKNTALIVYETHIWEVTLDNSNRTGIDWSLLANSGNFGLNVVAPGGAPDGVATPISITPTWTGSNSLNPETVLEFISEHGTVKTVSQPQLTVLSGASAILQVQQSENFVSGVQRTPSTTPGVPDTVSTTTQTVQTGLSVQVQSAWDQSTVYGNISIGINELLNLDTFNPDPNTTIQLPRTTARTLQTQVRVRPGDAILIGGLVTQKDNYSGSGPGFMRPLIQTARSAAVRNTELVFLLRPRVVVFVPGEDGDTPAVATAREERFGRASGRMRPLAAPGAASGSAAPGAAWGNAAPSAASGMDNPAAALAPVRTGAAHADITDEMNAVFGAGHSSSPPSAATATPLPGGISPAALAPSRPPAPQAQPIDSLVGELTQEEKPAAEPDGMPLPLLPPSWTEGQEGGAP